MSFRRSRVFLWLTHWWHKWEEHTLVQQMRHLTLEAMAGREAVGDGEHPALVVRLADQSLRDKPQPLASVDRKHSFPSKMDISFQPKQRSVWFLRESTKAEKLLALVVRLADQSLRDKPQPLASVDRKHSFPSKMAISFQPKQRSACFPIRNPFLMPKMVLR